MNYESELRKLFKLAKLCRGLQNSLPNIHTNSALRNTRIAEKKLDELLLRLAIALEVEERADEINLLE